jgi:hypothetical protein
MGRSRHFDAASRDVRRPLDEFDGGGGGSLQECVERGLLVEVQCREDPVFDTGERLFYLGESATAGRRQRDRVAASIL